MSDPLDRAADAARAEPVESAHWDELSGTVMRRIRATVRPGRRVLVPLTDETLSLTYVNERVIVMALRGALGAVEGLAPADIGLDLVDDVCSRVTLQIVARYGADLHELGARTREVVGVVLRGLMLEHADEVDVHVTVVDVTPGDPAL